MGLKILSFHTLVWTGKAVPSIRTSVPRVSGQVALEKQKGTDWAAGTSVHR